MILRKGGSGLGGLGFLFFSFLFSFFSILYFERAEMMLRGWGSFDGLWGTTARIPAAARGKSPTVIMIVKSVGGLEPSLSR